MSLGAEDGSVTDIFLPRWFAHDLPVIHGPLILLTAILHRRNLRQSHPAMRRCSPLETGRVSRPGGTPVPSTS